MPHGIVKWYNEGQGRGVITPEDGGRELAVAHGDIKGEGFKILYPGQRVNYEVGETGGGRAARQVAAEED